MFIYFRAIYLNIPGLVLSLVITTGCGLVIYAKYSQCDPVSLKQVKSADQVDNAHAIIEQNSNNINNNGIIVFLIIITCAKMIMEDVYVKLNHVAISMQLKLLFAIFSYILVLVF